MSRHLPVWVDRPEAADQVQKIQQVKRLEIEGDVVKFKFKSKQTGLGTSQPPEPKVEPSRGSRRGERPVTPERERSRGRSRQRRRRTKAVSPASRPMELRRVRSLRRSLSFRAGHRRPLQLRTWMCSTSVVRAEGWRQSLRRKIGPKPDPSTWVTMVCQSPSSCTMAKGCKDQPKIPRRLTEQCVSVERFWSQTKAHFGPTCSPSTACPRSCGKFGMWSTRFGRKNLRNQLKLQSQLKLRNRRRAGLLRLPPGQLSQRKPADQSLKSQGLNLWCSRLLKEQKAVGEKRPMTMQTSEVRLTSVWSVGEETLPHLHELTRKVRKKRSKLNLKGLTDLTVRIDQSDPRWRQRKRPVTTTCHEKRNGRERPNPPRPRVTPEEVVTGHPVWWMGSSKRFGSRQWPTGIGWWPTTLWVWLRGTPTGRYAASTRSWRSSAGCCAARSKRWRRRGASRRRGSGQTCGPWTYLKGQGLEEPVEGTQRTSLGFQGDPVGKVEGVRGKAENFKGDCWRTETTRGSNQPRPWVSPNSSRFARADTTVGSGTRTPQLDAFAFCILVRSVSEVKDPGQSTQDNA